MPFEQAGQPARLGPAPATLGRESEIRNEFLGDGDARSVARLVVVMKQTEIELGSALGRMKGPLPRLQPRVKGLVGALLRHRDMEEVDRPLGGGSDAFQHLDQDGGVLRLHEVLVGRRAVAEVVAQLDARRHRLAEAVPTGVRSEEHTSELQSRRDLVCRLLLEKKKESSTLMNRANTTT